MKQLTLHHSFLSKARAEAFSVNVLFTCNHIIAHVVSAFTFRALLHLHMLKFTPGEDGVFVVSLVSSHIRSLIRAKS